MIEPQLIKAGDERVKLGFPGSPPLVDCRVISEDNYKKLKKAYDERNLGNDREKLLEFVRWMDRQNRFVTIPDSIVDKYIKDWIVPKLKTEINGRTHINSLS